MLNISFVVFEAFSHSFDYWNLFCKQSKVITSTNNTKLILFTFVFCAIFNFFGLMSKETWSTVNELKNKSLSSFQIGPNANVLNNYFVTIAENLIDKISLSEDTLLCRCRFKNKFLVFSYVCKQIRMATNNKNN